MRRDIGREQKLYTEYGIETPIHFSATIALLGS